MEISLKDLKELFGTPVTENKLQHKLINTKVLVRTYSAGVHYGTLSEKNGAEVVLTNAIRVWSWSGAASLSQLAMEGTKKPDDCKFAMPVDSIELDRIEIIPCTHKAIESIEGVKSWKM